MFKVVITGKGGQLASELQATLAANIDAYFFDENELNITDVNAVFACLSKTKPDFVINAAAYTAVDKAETEKELAYAVNETGSAYLAEACKEFGAKLIHISTDFVFAGDSTTAYLPSDSPRPLSVYGASKLAGENKVIAILANQGLIIRTAWVYSAFGNNFVKTMLRLMQEKEQLGVVADQVGTPTWARGLALVIWNIVASHKEQNFAHSILHWTDAGVASWYDFAVSIQELALAKGILKKAIPILPISTQMYPTPAVRPPFSLLNKELVEQSSGISTVHWRKQLASMLNELSS